MYGLYHTHNSLKFRILNAHIELDYDKVHYNYQIADYLGVPIENIYAAMSHYNTFKRHYFKRMPKRTKHGYGYKLTEYGKYIYISLLKRFKVGLDLKLCSTKSKKMPHYQLKSVDVKDAILNGITDEEMANYIRVNRNGVAMGLLDNDKLLFENAGLFKEDT